MRTQPNRDPNFLPAAQARAFERELDQLVEVLSEGSRKGAYLKSEYKSKYLDPQGGVSASERERAAIDKWLRTEKRNEATNRRIQLGDEDFGWTTSDKLIAKTREYVAKVLGELTYGAGDLPPVPGYEGLCHPLVEWPSVFDCHSGHTNGASTRIKRAPNSSILKHAGEAHVSSDALVHWLRFARSSILNRQNLRIQESSVLFTVDKTSEIDRVACKEPEVNMFLQRSVGNHIRRRLRRFGVDLNDQTVNQRLARDAHLFGLATIDLSSASDSITRQLVFELLPFEWWSLLDDLRVKTVDVLGYTHELEMFSSMGNGFTFELESLLFWALARSVMYFSAKKGKLSVYGDDIIVPNTVAARLATVFHWFGFKVNPKKSFWKGPFRESCGKHYLRGFDVTPFYLREPVSCKTDIIRILNHLLWWDGRTTGALEALADPAIYRFHWKWARVIPRFLWGGVDLNDPGALVTGTHPAQRLVPLFDEVVSCQATSLVAWLVKRDGMGEVPLTFTTLKDRRQVKVVDQGEWTVRTTWRPWLLNLDLPSVAHLPD